VADGRDGDLFLCLYRSVITGELRSDLDLDVLVDVVYGPIFHRMLMEHAPLNDAFIEQVLRIALNGALVQE
jgi:predicted nucleotidyltransferase